MNYRMNPLVAAECRSTFVPRCNMVHGLDVHIKRGSGIKMSFAWSTKRIFLYKELAGVQDLITSTLGWLKHCKSVLFLFYVLDTLHFLKVATLSSVNEENDFFFLPPGLYKQMKKHLFVETQQKVFGKTASNLNLCQLQYILSVILLIDVVRTSWRNVCCSGGFCCFKLKKLCDNPRVGFSVDANASSDREVHYQLRLESLMNQVWQGPSNEDTE